MTNVSELKIFQWNAYGVNNKKAVLQTLCDDFDVLVIVETFLKPKMNFF